MTRILTFLADQVRILIAVAGLGLLAAGFAMAWMPLAFIVPGGLLLAVALLGAVIEARRGSA